MNFDEHVEEVAANLDFKSLGLVNVGNDMFLTTREITVLDNYDIPYRSCKTLKEIIFMIEDYLLEYDDLDLEEIEDTIAERDYYQNTKK